MQFASPMVWLLALPLQAAVVWLHMRRKVPERTRVFFPAFLTPGEPQRHQLNTAVRQPRLLVFRLLLVTLLVGMLAGPYREVPLVGAQAAQWVLVDASLSMRLSYDPAEPARSRFDEALQRASVYARRGAEVRLCGADLSVPEHGAEHGRMNLDRCLAAARSSYAGTIVVLTDGQGAESRVGMDPLIQYDYIGDVPAPGPGSVTQWQPMVLERGDEGVQLVRNLRSRGPIEVALRDVGAQGSVAQLSVCEAQQRCVLGEVRAQSWVEARVPAGVHEAGPHLAMPIEWAVPLLDPAQTVTVVASVAERGLYSGRQIMMEALDALAVTNPRYTITVAREPADLVGQRGFIVFLWDTLEKDAWTEALLRRDPSSVLWIIPSRLLPDTLVPRELLFGFGTYRGWLNNPTQVMPSAVLPGSAVARQVDWQSSTAAVHRRISIAETGTAETVLADVQGTPLVLWSGGPANTLLFTTGLDASVSEWALTPDFVPMLAVLLARYTPAGEALDRCVAASVQATGAVCPGLAGRSATAEGRVRYVVPDFEDLAPHAWRADVAASAQSTTRREPLSAWLAMAGVLILGACMALPGAWLALLLLCVGAYSPAQAQEVVDRIESDALGQSVYTVGALEPDQGRLDAFRRLSLELDRRANISLRVPQTARDKVPGGALVWVHLCRSTESALQAALGRAVEAVRQGAVLWVEDCATPDAATPAFRALTDALRTAKIASNWEPVGSRHVLFKSYYLLSRIEGRQLAGGERVITSDGMPIVLYTPQDVTGKVAYDGLTEARVRGFVNILFYLLMGDYKEDGIHVPYLLERLHRTRR